MSAALRPLDVQADRPLQLDRARICKAADGLLGVVSAYLPAEVREWARLHRPDVARYLAEGKDAVETAAKFGSCEDFLQALDLCLGHCLKAKRIYRKERGVAGLGSCGHG